MQCPLAPLQLIIVICLLFTLTFDASLQSEILIIRHGRSRSRHSIEKDHARWGLKSLSNLTLVERHDGSLEFSEIDSGTELNTLNVRVNNKSNAKITANSSSRNTVQSHSSEWNGTIGSFEINFTHNPSLVANDGKPRKKQTNLNDWIRQQRTTETPKSGFLPSSSSASLSLLPSSTSSPKQKQLKTSKEVKNAHENGIKAHDESEKERKTEIMLDIKNTVDKGIQYLKSHENLNEIKIEINDFHSAVDEEIVRRRDRNKIFRTQQFIPVAIKMDQGAAMNPSEQHRHQQRHQQQQQQRLIHENDVKQQAEEIKINGGKELGIVTILTSPNHQDTRNNVHSRRHPSKQLKSYSPFSAASLSDMSERSSGSRVGGNRNQFDVNSNLADVFYVPSSTEEPMLGDQAIHSIDEGKSNQIASTETPFGVDKSPKEDRKAARSHLLSSDSDTSLHDDILQDQGSHESADTAANVEMNESESFQNDEENIFDVTESSNYEDIEGDPVEEIEYDDNLDETSKQNRINLKLGRDVLTQFLRIVESQHMLGGNCTAGTETNLGEGVVDRYAQDRFRVEAEVAVNRANMLTR